MSNQPWSINPKMNVLFFIVNISITFPDKTWKGWTNSLILRIHMVQLRKKKWVKSLLLFEHKQVFSGMSGHSSRNKRSTFIPRLLYKRFYSPKRLWRYLNRIPVNQVQLCTKCLMQTTSQTFVDLQVNENKLFGI